MHCRCQVVKTLETNTISIRSQVPGVLIENQIWRIITINALQMPGCKNNWNKHNLYQIWSTWCIDRKPNMKRNQWSSAENRLSNVLHYPHGLSASRTKHPLHYHHGVSASRTKHPLHYHHGLSASQTKHPLHYHHGVSVSQINNLHSCFFHLFLLTWHHHLFHHYSGSQCCYYCFMCSLRACRLAGTDCKNKQLPKILILV